MTPRVGVYDTDWLLLETIHESFYGISNRDILIRVIAEPFYDIRRDLEAGGHCRFVLMERHRCWVEAVEERVGAYAPLPSWEELEHNEDWEEASGMCDAFFCDEPEWTIFGDDLEIAYDLADQIPYSAWFDDDLSTILALILQHHPDIEDLIVVTREMHCIYVVRSSKVEKHGTDVDDLAYNGWHAVDHLANATQPGDHLTYVLDDELVETYAGLLERVWEEEERQARSLPCS